MAIVRNEGFPSGITIGLGAELGVGIEHVSDIIADIEQALKKV